MGVFHVFKIVQTVESRATHHKYSATQIICKVVSFNQKQSEF